MSLPEPDDLDEMARLIAGPQADFESLGPEARIQVITLTNQCDAVSILSEIRDTLKDIEADTSHMGDWFRVSRTFDGL